MGEAERRDRADAGRAGESRRPVDGPRSRAPGLPPAVLGQQDALGRMPMRDFGAHRRPDVLPARLFGTRPALAPLSTAYDRRADRLPAGQALERVLLPAARRKSQGPLIR